MRRCAAPCLPSAGFFAVNGCSMTVLPFEPDSAVMKQACSGTGQRLGSGGRRRQKQAQTRTRYGHDTCICK